VEKEFIFEHAPFRSCHASTIVETERGLMAAWFGGSKEGAADVAIWGSVRGARGWSPPDVIADEPETACWNPVLFQERSGRLYLFYKAGPSPQTWSGFYRVKEREDADWREPVQMAAGLLGPSKNKPLQLKSGRIVAGTSVESYRAWAAWAELSDDGGRSWRRVGPIAVAGEPRGVIQPTIFETRHGLRMLMRSTPRIGRVCRADSFDEGETWTEAAVTDLPNPNSAIDAARLRDGRIVLCHNPVERGRTPLALSVSEDDGETWRETLVLERDEGEYSYPAIIETSSGEVHVTYTWRRERIAHAVIGPHEL
jgi:predicted neuraminidase